MMHPLYVLMLSVGGSLTLGALVATWLDHYHTNHQKSEEDK